MQSLGVIVPNQRTSNMSNSGVQQPTSQPQATSQNELISRLQEALRFQAVQFQRYKELTEQKFTTLSKDLLDVSIQLKEAQKKINGFEDKADVLRSRQALVQYQKGNKAPSDVPIDRTGVAPKDVQIMDIFNFSRRY